MTHNIHVPPSHTRVVGLSLICAQILDASNKERMERFKHLAAGDQVLPPHTEQPPK